MEFPKTLQEAIYRTIHRSKKQIEEIADEMGVTANLIYKWASPESSSSHADLPLRRLLNLLIITDNDTILDYFEHKRGRIAFRLPKKVALCRHEEGDMADCYAEVTTEAVKTLRAFIAKPTQANYEKLNEILRQVMCESMSIDKYCKRKSTGQMEMEL